MIPPIDSVRLLASLSACVFLLISSTSCERAEEVNSSKVDFATEVYPVLHASCVGCHRPPYKNDRGRPRYPEAHLVLTEKEAIIRGADSGEVIVPGKPDESELLLTILLPLDDDDHMPPVEDEEYPQLTKEETETLSRWIKEGCDFGDWVHDSRYPTMAESH